MSLKNIDEALMGLKQKTEIKPPVIERNRLQLFS